MALKEKFVADVAIMLGEHLLKDYTRRRQEGDPVFGLDSVAGSGDVRELIHGVRELINGNFISDKSLKTLYDRMFDGDDVSSDAIADAIESLKQGLAMVTGEEDLADLPNILTATLLKRLNRCPRCDGSARFQEKFDETRSKEILDGMTNNERRIRFWFDSRLPQVQGGKLSDLFIEAWEPWIEIAQINVLVAQRRERANLIISMADIDRRKGGVLEDANVGPIGAQVFTLRYDSGEGVWDPGRFRQTTMHEIGHILGLTHAREPGHLMSPLLDPQIKKPSKHDAERLLNLPGDPWKPQEERNEPDLLPYFVE